MLKILKERKGSSMLLSISIFFILAVLGISLMNAANANIRNTRNEYDKEQALLYISSVFDTINHMIEEGKFSVGGSLPGNNLTDPADRLQAVIEDGAGKDLTISIGFDTSSAIVQSELVVAYFYPGQSGAMKYMVKATYEKQPGGKYRLLKCKGIEQNG